jgi:peptide/nickel transport system substrate-binding protein
MSLGRALSLDQALRVGEQWPDGRVATRTYGWVPVNPQHVDPNPSIVATFPFKQAMLEAIDRQQLVDSLMAGKTSIAGSIVPPDAPEYRDIESSIVRYPYDPRQAAQLLEGLGYTKGADGLYHDPGGQPLAVEIKFPVQNDIHGKMTAAVADMWQQFGVSVEQTPIPIQRMTDREYVAAYPSFELIEVGLDATVRNVMRFHSSSTPLPENRFTATGNYSRYRNPELDTALESYITTIPVAPRMQALAAVVGHMSRNLSTLPLIHTVTPTVVSNRIQNVTGKGARSTEAWNAQEWDVR